MYLMHLDRGLTRPSVAHGQVPESDPRPWLAGKTVPANIFRQNGLGYSNSARSIGHGGAHGQVRAPYTRLQLHGML